MSCECVSVTLEVWDTSGDVLALSSAADFYVLCFALDQLDSYHSIKSKWYPEVQRCAPNVPIILVGTKCDGVGKMITTGMGEELREALKAFVYVECSARKRLSLHAVFEEAARSVLSTSSLLSVSPGDDGRDIGGAKGMPSWLESYLDVHLFDEAVRFRAQKRDLISRMDTAKYLDRWRADGAAGI